MKSRSNRFIFITELKRQLHEFGNLVIMTDRGSAFVDAYGHFHGLDFTLEYLERRGHLAVYFYQNPIIPGSRDDSQEDQILRQGLAKIINRILPIPMACSFESEFMPEKEGKATKYWVLEWDIHPERCFNWRLNRRKENLVSRYRYETIDRELSEIHQIEGDLVNVEPEYKR